MLIIAHTKSSESCSHRITQASRALGVGGGSPTPSPSKVRSSSKSDQFAHGTVQFSVPPVFSSPSFDGEYLNISIS